MRLRLTALRHGQALVDEQLIDDVRVLVTAQFRSCVQARRAWCREPREYRRFIRHPAKGLVRRIIK
jgi:hypothetical protein